MLQQGQKNGCERGMQEISTEIIWKQALFKNGFGSLFEKSVAARPSLWQPEVGIGRSSLNVTWDSHVPCQAAGIRLSASSRWLSVSSTRKTQTEFLPPCLSLPSPWCRGHLRSEPQIRDLSLSLSLCLRVPLPLCKSSFQVKQMFLF